MYFNAHSAKHFIQFTRSFSSYVFPAKKQSTDILKLFPSVKSFKDLYKFSIDENRQFWATIGEHKVLWQQKFNEVNRSNMATGDLQWYIGGKLNVSVNCVDRHLSDRTALIWEQDEPNQQQFVSYRDLYGMMNEIANTLKAHGVRRGDRVAIYMPMTPMLPACMLACARIGAVHTVVFAGFSADALATRINDANCETVICSNEAVRGGRTIPLKRIVGEALKQCACVKRVFVHRRTNTEFAMEATDIDLGQEMGRQRRECEPEWMDSEDPLFLLYTSGSTGKPKGLVHTQAGYLVYAALTQQLVFDYRAGDIFGCVADIGWITGHTYTVYGPLCNGGTSVLFESTPVYPNPSRYWEMVQRLRLTQIYLAPTALRTLLKFDDALVTRHDRSSLRVLGSVGEPLNSEAWHWYFATVGNNRLPIVDTWWQTETGGICIAPMPADEGDPICAAMPMRPFLGVLPLLVDDQARRIAGNDPHENGRLCIDLPWPAMARTLYGNRERFLDTYYRPVPGCYLTGDAAHRLVGGYYQIAGRVDDVINVSGHRLGTAEVEDVLDEHHMVAETAVVGFKHDVKGEGIYAFVILRANVTESHEDIRSEMKQLVRQKIAAFAVPDFIQFTPGLPKTRSGKIMRRLLRLIASGRTADFGDVTTLADPDVVKTLVAGCQRHAASSS